MFESSSNPTFNDDVLDNLEDLIYDRPSNAMTVTGTLIKIGFLTMVVVLAAIPSYYLMSIKSPLAWPITIGSVVGAFLVAMYLSGKPDKAPTLAPIYAILEGLFVGGISAFFAARTDFIIVNAIGLTISTVITMLFIYKTGIIKVTQKFRSVMATILGAIMIYYVSTFILSFFGIYLSHWHNNGIFSIVICLAILVVAALSLLLDFDLIERCVEKRSPKSMEWYASFGVLVTIVWLYTEFLRLISLFSE